MDTDLVLEIRTRVREDPGATATVVAHVTHGVERSRLLRLDRRSASLTDGELQALANPLTETVQPTTAEPGRFPSLDVFCRAGVTDAEGEMASLALAATGLKGVTCRAGTRYRFDAPVEATLRRRFEREVGNPLIHVFRWSDEPQHKARHDSGAATPEVRVIELAGLTDEDLAAVSRRESLALDVAEMREVQRYFEGKARHPTDVELQSIALAWSEHCSHKTFKARIEFESEGLIQLVDGLLRTYIVDPTAQLDKPWVRSAFVDNAGIIAFDDRHDLAVKVETHNHPSAVEPYGGAHTGVGGVIRDVLAVSAEPIANTDVLCFGPIDTPEADVTAGAHHPSATLRGVIRGIGGYGNNMGIPTVGGAVLFEAGYTANPLVFCGTVGILPTGSHPTEPRTGDAVVLLGGRTGRDGLHGATMSSEALDRETVAGSTVQIGAPITEKILLDVLPRLRDERIYDAITDCGAGGLCSAIGEMGNELGVDIDLALVPLKYPSLAPWEIWLSEAQERMVLSVPPSNLARLGELCRDYGAEVTVLGALRDDRRMVLRYGESVVADLDLALMHGGCPKRNLRARWSADHIQPSTGPNEDAERILLTLLAHPNIASKEAIIRRYDHEVQGGTVVKPMVGRNGPSDAAVLRPIEGSPAAVVIGHGINPWYGRVDPQAMAMLGVDEALRNVVAVGASIDRVALLDNFCWGAVDDPDELGRLVRTAQGCREAALLFETPFICGKDSLRNVSLDGHGTHSIPGTILITAVAVMEDSAQCITMDLKAPENRIYIVGETHPETGGSHLELVTNTTGGVVPTVRAQTPGLMRSLTNAIQAGLVKSCHDLSEGGLAVAAAEMVIAGGLGMSLDLQALPGTATSDVDRLFSESSGRFLVEVSEEDHGPFEERLSDLPCRHIGLTSTDAQLEIKSVGGTVIRFDIGTLEGAWRTPLSPWPDKPLQIEVTPGAGTVLMATPTTEPGLMPAETRTRRKHNRTAVRLAVLEAPGINCDRETASACRLAGADVELVHLNQLLSGRHDLDEFGALIIPGGFAYGDHLGAGSMLATVLKHQLPGALDRFVASGRPVVGICNGFQVLARLGILGPVALAPNAHGLFECRWVPLEQRESACPFVDGLGEFELPIAHGEGRLVVESGALTDVLARAPLRYRANPNGSTAHIAGVSSRNGNVLGLMPHPERFVRWEQHPDRRPPVDRPAPAGLTFFRNVVRYAATLE